MDLIHVSIRYVCTSDDGQTEFTRKTKETKRERTTDREMQENGQLHLISTLAMGFSGSPIELPLLILGSQQQFQFGSSFHGQHASKHDCLRLESHHKFTLRKVQRRKKEVTGTHRHKHCFHTQFRHTNDEGFITAFWQRSLQLP